MTDADVDGSHIDTLIMTLFFRYFPQVIQQGYLYIATPPLYLCTKGKVKEYCWTDQQRQKFIDTSILNFLFTNLTSYNEEAPDGQEIPVDRSFSYIIPCFFISSAANSSSAYQSSPNLRIKGSFKNLYTGTSSFCPNKTAALQTSQR